MVKTLIRHEFRAYGRVMLPTLGILLGLAAANRILQFFESNNALYDALFTSSVITLVIGALACLAMCTVFGVIRFYKNLFTGEGYLSFTLPVTPGQHLFVKLLVSFLYSLITLAGILVAGSIATAGEVWWEVIKAAGYLMNRFFALTGYHGWLYLLEGTLLLAAASVSGMLLFYACMCIGQLAKKNRVLAAVGVYYGYYIVCQVLSTATTTLVAISADLPFWEAIGAFIEKHPFASVHIGLCAILAVTVGLALVYYFLSRHILYKRLNLE